MGTVRPHAAGIDIVKSVQQVGDGGFPRAGGAHEGDLLTGLGIKTQPLQNRHPGGIGKDHIVEPDVTPQGNQRPVRLFPRPPPGGLPALRSRSVRAERRVDQRDGAVVRLGRFLHENSKQLVTNIDPSVIIAVSQSGESNSVIDDVKTARQNGFKVVSFTKREDSTLAQLSDITFIVDGSKQTLIGGLPNPFFGRVILAFEELIGYYFTDLQHTDSSTAQRENLT